MKVTIITSIIYGIIVLASLILSIYTSYFSIIFIILASVTVGILCYKGKYIVSSLSCIIVVAIMCIITNTWIIPTMTVLGVVLSGTLIGITLKKGYGLKEVVTSGGIGFIAQFLMHFAIYNINGENIFIAAIEKIRVSQYQAVEEAFKEMGSSVDKFLPGGINSLSEMYNKSFDVLEMIIPALMMIYTGIIAYIIVAIVVAILRKNGSTLDNIIAFSNIRANRIVGLVFAISILVSMGSSGATAGLLTNFKVVFMAYFVVCGIAVLDFFVKKKFANLGIRIIIYIPAFILLSSGIVPFFNPILIFMFVGIIDSSFDFRKLRTVRGDQNGR